MSGYIKRILTNEGEKQIDYNALANLPNLDDIDQLINAKQNATDETLKTNDKTIVGAINEINGKIPTVDDILNALPTWQGGAY